MHVRVLYFWTRLNMDALLDSHELQRAARELCACTSSSRCLAVDIIVATPGGLIGLLNVQATNLMQAWPLLLPFFLWIGFCPIYGHLKTGISL